jgi:hypothetical protein
VGGTETNSGELAAGPTVEDAADPGRLEAYWLGGEGREWRRLPRFNGAIHARSENRLTDLNRGTSNTFLIVEKFITTANYDTGLDPGDNECMYTGINNDVSRSTFDPPLQDTVSNTGIARPTFRIGSAHSSAFNVVLGDGSVRSIAYSVDPVIFRVYGDRTSGSALLFP